MQNCILWNTGIVKVTKTNPGLQVLQCPDKRFKKGTKILFKQQEINEEFFVLVKRLICASFYPACIPGTTAGCLPNYLQ